ncbi:hypothetical protein [Pantoea stewartii]|uniref:Uncharacterized protein n=1 Tax=Pantoea stewartii subsp. stewartii DC283 TaxID=660596 RepID=H3R9R8_PANSE|nr:hypothetical protein [Pantoea stewartii]ARF51380.1 hypothetical protein DSJ_20025 [Pantoea stewartii subsp. stewartii DC283]EHU01931.1 hypothetical protein CKS_0400 [Pantoea stewartii subsp. stewartii DC283]
MNRILKHRDEAGLRDVLSTLHDIRSTLDSIDARLSVIEDSGMKHGAVSGTLSGALSGAVVSVGLALVRASAGV